MVALIIGATGATGKDLVHILLQDPFYEKVIIFVRKKSFPIHAKLSEHIVDFDDFGQWKDLVKGDIAFSCLGTTLKIAGSKEAQWKIDYEYELAFAKIAKENNISHFVLLSAYGSNADSKMFYPMMKGKLEKEIELLQFSQLDIFRPGILDRKNTDRFSEKIGVRIMNSLSKIGILTKYKPLATKDLAYAMSINAKKKSDGIHFYDLNKITNY